MRQPTIVSWIAALVMVVALTGCKSKSTTTTNTPSVSNTSGGTASCVIPQNNGCDHDADNNGGPDDGDGCDK